MWWPCFHHILELVLGAVIQQRWKTGGPRDAIYTRFKTEWPNLLAAMPEILRDAKEKVNLFVAEDDVTRKLRRRLTTLLQKLTGESGEILEEGTEGNGAVDGDAGEGRAEDGGAEDEDVEMEDEGTVGGDEGAVGGDEGAVGGEEGAAEGAEKDDREKSKPKIPQGDYMEFIKLVSVK